MSNNTVEFTLVDNGISLGTEYVSNQNGQVYKVVSSDSQYVVVKLAGSEGAELDLTITDFYSRFEAIQDAWGV